MACDLVYDTLALALNCAKEYVAANACDAVFVTDPLGEIVYCYETGFEKAYKKVVALESLVSINPYPADR